MFFPWGDNILVLPFLFYKLGSLWQSGCRLSPLTTPTGASTRGGRIPNHLDHPLLSPLVIRPLRFIVYFLTVEGGLLFRWVATLPIPGILASMRFFSDPLVCNNKELPSRWGVNFPLLLCDSNYFSRGRIWSSLPYSATQGVTSAPSPG